MPRIATNSWDVNNYYELVRENILPSVPIVIASLEMLSPSSKVALHPEIF